MKLLSRIFKFSPTLTRLSYDEPHCTLGTALLLDTVKTLRHKKRSMWAYRRIRADIGISHRFHTCYDCKSVVINTCYSMNLTQALDMVTWILLNRTYILALYSIKLSQYESQIIYTSVSQIKSCLSWPYVSRIQIFHLS
jgi:hypothetical protein